MKIALCSTCVPFVYGGDRNIVDWLERALSDAGHHIEKIYLPEVDAVDTLFQQMMAYRWLDLSAADRIICIRPQAHLVPHRHKILWFIHHLRQFYDLWETPYRSVPDNARHQAFREALRCLDCEALREARTIFTNSKVVSARLKAFNDIDSQVLYPPVFQPERFHLSGFSDEVVCVWRLEHHKRAHLLIEAMKHTRTPVRLRLSGPSCGPQYPQSLSQRIAELDVSSRVVLDYRWISEQEKVTLLSECLAVAYLPLDEDSYGYPSLEASHSSKPILTTEDSGGVLEFVLDGVNGYVTEATPEAIAEAMDRLYLDRGRTEAMGRNARARLVDLDISWARVLQSLLA